MMAIINRFSPGVTGLTDTTAVTAGSEQDSGTGHSVSQLAICTMVWCGGIAVKGSDKAL
jgi:hypothetical protein